MIILETVLKYRFECVCGVVEEGVWASWEDRERLHNEFFKNHKGDVVTVAYTEQFKVQTDRV